jgi:hypothetical protein
MSQTDAVTWIRASTCALILNLVLSMLDKCAKNVCCVEFDPRNMVFGVVSVVSCNLGSY